MFKKIKKINKIEFIRHGKNYLIGEFFSKGIVFISIPIFTRLLAPDEYGILSLITSLILILSTIFGLNLKAAIARKYHEKENDFNSFYYSIMVFSIMYVVINFLIIKLNSDSISTFLKIDSKVFKYALVISVCMPISNYYMAYLQTSKQSLSYSAYNAIKSTSIFILSIIFIVSLQNQKYFGRIYSETIVVFVLGLYFFIKSLKLSEMKFKKEHVIYGLKFGVPLIPHTLSAIILAQFDRIIINQTYGMEQVGIYSLAYNIGMIMQVVNMACTKIWTPIFYEKMNQRDNNGISKLVKKYSVFIYAVAFILIVFSKELLWILGSSEYYEAIKVIPLVIIGYVFIFLYTLYASYSFYRKKTLFISINTFIAGFTNLFLNYIYVPRYGYIAAAWTTLISYILLLILHYINSKYILKEEVFPLSGLMKDFFVLLIFSITAVYSYSFDNYLFSLAWRGLLMLLYSLYMIRKVK